MQILLTNDDGIFAPGLAAIYRELVKLGDVTVAAPAEGQSGASHRITLNNPLLCKKVTINDQFTGYSIAGSPADCVKLAVIELCQKPIDLLVSGINSGANAGVNVYYSGTVAAAMEGAFLNIPSVAMSLTFEHEQKMDFTRAADYCVQTIKKLMPVQPGCVLNINIPRLSKGAPKGVRVVPQATSGYEECYIKEHEADGESFYSFSGQNNREEDTQTDVLSLMEGFITVTALTADMTDHKKTAELKNIKW